MIVCKLCEKEIVSLRSAWKEQTGWVSPVGAKGMTLAHTTGELAHDECVNLLRLGVDVKQGSLL